MAEINYLGKKVSLENMLKDYAVPEQFAQDHFKHNPVQRYYLHTFQHTDITDSKYTLQYETPDNDYKVIEVDFIGAGQGWYIKGMFVPGNDKPYVLRHLHGPDKYRTAVHELVHSEFYDAGIPQSEYDVRRITSTRTDFRDYWGL